MFGDKERFLATEAVLTPALVQALQKYTEPCHDRYEEQRNINTFGIENLPKKPIGLVIGRFQPLHPGHVYLIKMALAACETVIIGIGSANVTDRDNPFSAKQRKFMMQETLIKESLFHRVGKITPLKDYDDDERWLQETLAQTGNVDMVVGNNDWVNSVFLNAGIAAIEIPLLERVTYKGEAVREKLRSDGFLQSMY